MLNFCTKLIQEKKDLKKKKKQHHPQILLIQIFLGSKFQLQQAILIFLK